MYSEPSGRLIPPLRSATYSRAANKVFERVTVNDQERKNFPFRKAIKARCRGGFCLLEKSVEWLKTEIEILKPDFVLLGFGREEWKNIQGDNSHHRVPIRLDESWMKKIKLEHRPTGIWVTYHFSSWTTRHKENGHGTLLLEMKKALKESLEPVR